MHDKIEAKREANRPILKQVNQSVVARVRRGFHVVVEHPHGSESFEQPEMGGIRQLIDEGKLMTVVFDGCQVGYRDSESKLPNLKPMRVYTTMDTLIDALEDKSCRGCRQHEQLKGHNKNGSRTLQAAEWPDQLNNIVARSILQQAVVDNSLESERQFPVEGGGDQRGPVRRGRPRRLRERPVRGEPGGLHTRA